MFIQKFRYVFITVVVVVGVLFFLGKTKFILNPIARLLYVKYYTWQLNKDKNIDSEKFWEFRDFYSSTTSVFKSENIAEGKPFLIFSNSSIQSLDFLVPENSPIIKKFVVPNNSDIIIQSKNEIVYADRKTFVIKFVKQVQEMQKVNGFFSYFGIDIDPYKDYLWYNETTIKM